MVIHMRTVADAIQVARGRVGISQNELARRAGMKPSTLSRRLDGKYPWRVDELAALARVLGCPVSELWPEPNGGAA